VKVTKLKENNNGLLQILHKHLTGPVSHVSVWPKSSGIPEGIQHPMGGFSIQYNVSG
jgi:hypothetical protein